MTDYINLTTYLASNEQRELGVIDVDGNTASALAELLAFTSPPSPGDMKCKASEIALIAKNLSIYHRTNNVLINGKSFFLPTLVAELQKNGLNPFYTFAQSSMSVSNGVVKNKTYKHKALISCAPEF